MKYSNKPLLYFLLPCFFFVHNLKSNTISKNIFFNPPPNDSCINAIPLAVAPNGVCTTILGTNVGATDSGVPLISSCGNYQGGDVWFSLVVPASGHVVVQIKRADYNLNTGMYIYGGSCGALTNKKCDVLTGLNQFSYVELFYQTPGETLYIRVWDESNNSFGDFSICAYEPHYLKKNIATSFNHVESIDIGDFNDDGKMDVIGVSASLNEVALWQQENNQSFTKIVLVNDLEDPDLVLSGDIDSDGDLDIVSAGDTAIIWLENLGDFTFQEHLITDSVYLFGFQIDDIACNDIDSDGDMDVFSSAYYLGEIAWWENDGIENFTKRIIDSMANNPTSVFPVDLDDDSYIDLVVTSFDANDIIWYKNDGNENFIKQIIDNNFKEAKDVIVIDLDGDFDKDIVGIAWDENELAWWENDGNQIFTKHLIANLGQRPVGFDVGDMDHDNDLDILCGSSGVLPVSWWENDGMQNFSPRTIPSLLGSTSSKIIDMDGDSINDVLAGFRGDHLIRWWKNNCALPLECVQMTNPSNGATNVSVNPNLSWMPSSAPVLGNYVALGTSPNGKEIYHNFDVGNTTSFSPNTLSYNTTYYVQIIPYDSTGIIPGCLEESFTTEASGCPDPMDNIAVETGEYGAHYTIAEDLDQDGDPDIIGLGWNKGHLSWWENKPFGNFERHIIDSSSGSTGSSTISSIDLDQDGDIDVLGTFYWGRDIVWWENDGNQDFIKHIIESDFYGVSRAQAVDLDNDGDLDVVATASLDDEIAWWENDGNQSFTKHTIVLNIGGPGDVFAVDIENDGDIDILSSTRTGDEIALWQNDGNQNFTKDLIATNFDLATGVFAYDLDKDGDLDILGTSAFGREVCWWEQLGATTFVKRIIDDDLSADGRVECADIDNDGDIDVFEASRNADAWWENDGNQNFTRQYFVHHNSFTFHPSIVDINSNGDLDIIISFDLNEIVWLRSACIKIPDCPEIVSPENGGSDIDVNTSISWKAAYNATGYKISLGTTSGGTDLLDTTDIGNALVYHPSTLPYDKTIYVNIIPYNGNGNAIGCIELEFVTEPNVLPNCVTLSQPLNGATNVSINSGLSWDPAVGNQVNYKLFVGQNSGTYNLYNNLDVGNINNFSPGLLPFNSPIYVKILPENAQGNTPVCPEEIFYTNSCAMDLVEHVIADVDGNLYNILSNDIDGDGDIDIVTKSDDLQWWENDGSQNFTTHTIASNFNTYPIYNSLTSNDIDNDGDFDILAGSWNKDELVLFENDGNGNFSEILIDSFFCNYDVEITDLNQDGFLDILSNSQEQICWWENDGNQTFTKKQISFNNPGCRSINSQDIDGDGDIDIVSSINSMGTKETSWWENDGSENFTEHFIDNLLVSPGIKCIDVDSDGDMDIVAPTPFSWWENDGEQNFSRNIIEYTFAGVQEIFPVDLEQDGDIDMVCSSRSENYFMWWENDGAANFQKHVFDTIQNEASGVFVIDLDLDGDNDIIGATNDEDTFKWYENKCLDRTPDCTYLTEPLGGGNHVNPNTTLVWDKSTIAEGYKLSIGTKPNVYNILDQFDVGIDTIYNPPLLPSNRTIYVKINPYNLFGETTTCWEEHFTTECNLTPFTFNWIGSNGTWGAPFLWDLGFIPSNCDEVIIPFGDVIIPIGTSAFAKTLEVKLGATLEIKLGAELTVE